ncbi:MAG TPA: hypothetical protein VHT75_20350 [Acidimicrobiales bacterium]|jgi:hypothetical protein|nr:hypothetical protein [Acidimicrobiales bacterium]
MDTVDTVSIRVELIDELSGGIAKTRAELTSLAATVKKLDEGSAAAAAGGLDKVGKQFDALSTMGKNMQSNISDLVDWIGTRLVSAAKLGAEALGALTVAGAAWGLKTAESFQQASLSVNTFLGDATQGAAVFQQLKALVGPVSIGDLTQGFQSLATAGASPKSDVAMLKSIADISAVQQNPGQAFQGLSQAINRIQETGLVESRALLAFMSNGVDAYGLLSQEMGVPRDEVKKMLSSGGSIAAPTAFLSDFANESGPLSKFSGGLSKERQTLPGELSLLKADMAQALAAGVQPITDWLGKETPKITDWVNGVRDRMGVLGPAIAADWKSGNWGAFGQDLDTLLGGGGKYVGDLESLGKGLHGFAQIVTNDIIPFGRDLLAVAVPALKGLADVLNFFGEHKGLIEGALLVFTGFVVVDKVAASITALAKSFEVLKIIVGTGDFLGAISAFLAGMGLGGGKSPASAPGISSAETATAAAAGGGGLKSLGTVAMGAGGVYLASQGLKGKGWKSDAELIGGGALMGATIGSVVPIVGTAVGGAVGALAGGITDVFKHLWGNNNKKGGGGGGGGNTVIVHPGGIVVSGVSDPTQAANQVGQSVADQIDAANKLAAERSQVAP